MGRAAAGVTSEAADEFPAKTTGEGAAGDEHVVANEQSGAHAVGDASVSENGVDAVVNSVVSDGVAENVSDAGCALAAAASTAATMSVATVTVSVRLPSIAAVV